MFKRKVDIKKQNRNRNDETRGGINDEDGIVFIDEGV